MERRKITEAFHPGKYLKDELKERKWSIAKLAQKMRFHFSPFTMPIVKKDLKEIVAGRLRMSPWMAKCLGEAFGTSTEMWLNLQTAYDAQIELRSARRQR